MDRFFVNGAFEKKEIKDESGGRGRFPRRLSSVGTIAKLFTYFTVEVLRVSMAS